MPTLTNTQDKPLEVEINGKTIILKPGESIKIPNLCDFKASGSFVIR